MSNTETQKLSKAPVGDLLVEAGEIPIVIGTTLPITIGITKTINQTKTVTKAFDSVKNEVTTTTVITTETTTVKVYENKQPQTTTVVTTKTTVTTRQGKNKIDMTGSVENAICETPADSCQGVPTFFQICETPTKPSFFQIRETPKNEKNEPACRTGRNGRHPSPKKLRLANRKTNSCDTV